jgi:hypothetical protein
LDFTLENHTLLPYNKNLHVILNLVVSYAWCPARFGRLNVEQFTTILLIIPPAFITSLVLVYSHLFLSILALFNFSRRRNDDRRSRRYAATVCFNFIF